MFCKGKTVLLNAISPPSKRENFLDGCLYVLRDEDQAYARIDRMGNRNPRVITYRLVTNAWVELKILQRQARRKAIIQAAVDTTVLEWLRALEEQDKREQEDAAKKEAHEMM